MAQQAAAAVAAANRIKKATDLPPFFGVPSKDQCSARQLMDRMTHAARIAGWNQPDQKCDNFYLLLRDRALVWWDQLKYEGIDVDNDWDAVKADFLRTYEPKYTAKTTCANFSDLTQRQGEGVHDYYLRVCESMSRIVEAKPDALTAVRAAVLPVGAAVAAVAQADREAIKAEGILDAEKFFRHQIFLAGISPHLRSKVMEANKDTLRESVTLALELETIHSERRVRTVAAVAEDAREEAEHDFDDEELEAVNAIRQRNGKPPFRRRFQRSGPSSNSATAGSSSNFNKCRYCKQPGHLQKNCSARINARAPMVDKDGKPYSRKVSSVGGSNVAAANAATAAPGHATSQPNPESSVGSILSSALNTLNW